MPPPPQPMNLSSAPGQAALVSYLQLSHRYMLNESGTATYTLQFDSVPNAATTMFNGSGPAYSVVETVVLTTAGQMVASGSTTVYYLLNPYMPLGQVSSTGTPYGVVISSTPVPTTINVGDSGTVDALLEYHDSNRATVDANVTVNYAVTANDSTTLLFCLNTTISGVTAQGAMDGLADGTESDCFTVDASGSASLDSITLTINGMAIKFVPVP